MYVGALKSPTAPTGVALTPAHADAGTRTPTTIANRSARHSTGSERYRDRAATIRRPWVLLK